MLWLNAYNYYSEPIQVKNGNLFTECTFLHQFQRKLFWDQVIYKENQPSGFQVVLFHHNLEVLSRAGKNIFKEKY